MYNLNMKNIKDEVFWKNLEEKIREISKERVKEIVKENIGEEIKESDIKEDFWENSLDCLSAESLKEALEEKLTFLLDTVKEMGFKDDYGEFLVDNLVNGVVDGLAYEVAYDLMDSLDD